DIRSGAVWPDNLKFNLQRSKHLGAVLSPPYFRSAWCQAELNTFIRRMQVCHERKPNRRYEITHPVIFADGKHFPPEVAKLQHADFSPWGFDLPYETFSQVPCY